MYSIRSNSEQRFVYGPFEIRRINPEFAGDNQHEARAFNALKLLEHKKCGIDSHTPLQISEYDGTLTLMYRGSLVNENSHGERILLSPHQVLWATDGKSIKRSESTPIIAAEFVQLHFDCDGVSFTPDTQLYQRTPAPEDAGEWSLLLGNTQSGAPMHINQPLAVYDAKMMAPQTVKLPQGADDSALLYVVDGEIEIAGERFYAGDFIAQFASALPDIVVIQHSTLLCIVAAA